MSSMIEGLQSKLIGSVNESIAGAKAAVVDYATAEFENWLNGGGFAAEVGERLQPTLREFEAQMAMLEPTSSTGKGRKQKSASLPGFTVETTATDV